MIKNIIGYEDFYTIDEQGNVFSKRRKRYLKPYPDKNGYLYVTLSVGGNPKKRKIHRLVALNFLSNSENKPCLDHIDRNVLNNHYSNLRFVTPKENSNNPNTIRHLKKIGVKYKTEYGKPIKDTKGNRYISIIEASRKTGTPRANIQYHLKNGTGVWLYA